MTSKKQVKTFVLKAIAPYEVKILQDFIRNTIFSGMDTRENLFVLMESFNQSNNIKEKIATESEMIELLHKAGLKTTKQVLIKHRQQGNLSGMFSVNDRGRVVYRAVPVIKFFKKRQGKGSGGWLNRVKTKGRQKVDVASA